MGGPIGLRYEAVYPLLDRTTQDPEEWQLLFDGIRAIESGALEQVQRDKTT